jgi:hypothetical protein
MTLGTVAHPRASGTFGQRSAALIALRALRPARPSRGWVGFRASIGYQVLAAFPEVVWSAVVMAVPQREQPQAVTELVLDWFARQ